MANKEKYKIGLLSFIKPGIFPFVLFSITTIFFVPILIKTNGTNKEIEAWIVSIIVIGFASIPPLILQINYFLNDKNKCIEINGSERSMVFFNGDEKQIINLDEISCIEKYHSGDNADQDIITRKMHWVHYYYYKIVLKDKDPIYVSRLLIDKLEKKIQGIEFKYISVSYPLIRKNKVYQDRN